MTLAEKILYCRKRTGLSQEALAERLGVSRQAISKWETGEAMPEVTKLAALAKVFGVTADWLISDEEPVQHATEKIPPQTRTSDWTDNLPKELGRLIRRYGWLFGVYIAAIGAGITLIGVLAKAMVKSMFVGFDTLYGFESIIRNNPVSIMATAFIILGIVLIIIGVALAIYLRSKDDRKKQ